MLYCHWGKKKKPVRYREARFIEVPPYVYTGPPVLPHGSEDHILLIQNLDLGSFTLRQKPKRLHTFSNIMTCANAKVQDLISLLLKHFFLVLKR